MKLNYLLLHREIYYLAFLLVMAMTVGGKRPLICERETIDEAYKGRTILDQESIPEVHQILSVYQRRNDAQY